MRQPEPRARDVFMAVFSRHAAAYRDRLCSSSRRGETRGRARVIELLGPPRGARVLDLGCGPGVLTLPLAEAVGACGLVVGVDLSEAMLALTAAAAPRQVALARMDMERLGFAGGAFDAVACGHSLQFCPDLALTLGECRRVLRRGGRFAASLPAPGPPATPGQLLDEVLERHLPAMPAPAEVSATRELVADADRLRAALAGAGFRAAELETVAEVMVCSGPGELVERTLSWWSCAWRLEPVPEAAREGVRAEAVELLRERLGDGPLEIPGNSWVLSGLAAP